MRRGIDLGGEGESFIEPIHGHDLILSINLTIQSIAETVGYSNKSHFAIMFRRSTGMTPAEYKNRAVL